MFFCESVHLNLSFLKIKPWVLNDPFKYHYGLAVGQCNYAYVTILIL